MSIYPAIQPAVPYEISITDSFPLSERMVQMMMRMMRRKVMKGRGMLMIAVLPMMQMRRSRRTLFREIRLLSDILLEPLRVRRSVMFGPLECVWSMRASLKHVGIDF